MSSALRFVNPACMQPALLLSIAAQPATSMVTCRGGCAPVQAPSSNGGSYGAFSQPLSAIAAAAAALPRAGSSAQASNQPGGVPSSHQQQQHSQAPPLQQQQQQQHSGFAPSQYAQQLQNHLLLQQGGGFPFLSPGVHRTLQSAWQGFPCRSYLPCSAVCNVIFKDLGKPLHLAGVRTWQAPD